MQILILSRYTRIGASSRIRMLQYIPYLEKRGCNVAVSSLFSDNYLQSLYEKGSRNYWEVAQSYIVRGLKVLGAGRYDLLWIEKELFPFMPSWGETLARVLGIPYIVDYDDAVYHTYDRHPSPVVRFLMGNKIDSVMRQSAMVVAGNDYLAERARRAGAGRVEHLPSVVDLNRYSAPSPSEKKGDFTIGWIGSPSISHYLRGIESALVGLGKGNNTRVVLVGAGRIESRSVAYDARTWTEETEVADIQTFDVGIMPLPDDPWGRGKCGYKLIQYMACGLPVVASPVGVNKIIVEHGVNGFLASSTDEWTDALRILKDNPELRRRMGEAGRRKVEREYCLQVTAPRLYQLIMSVK